jgi:hypothetical protein
MERQASSSYLPRIAQMMKRKTAKPAPQDGDGARRRLSDLREVLLRLHKTLVDSERVSYENAVGPIPSPNQFLHLLTNDPWFAWLQPFSQLIVSMDEALEEKEPLTADTVDALVKETRRLLVASENGPGFAGHYFVALQRDPDVVLAHGEAAKLFHPKRRTE